MGPLPGWESWGFPSLRLRGSFSLPLLASCSTGMSNPQPPYKQHTRSPAISRQWLFLTELPWAVSILSNSQTTTVLSVLRRLTAEHREDSANSRDGKQLYAFSIGLWSIKDTATSSQIFCRTKKKNHASNTVCLDKQSSQSRECTDVSKSRFPEWECWAWTACCSGALHKQTQNLQHVPFDVVCSWKYHNLYLLMSVPSHPASSVHWRLSERLVLN